MIIELKNCSLEIAYIGTQEQIDMQKTVEYLATEFPNAVANAVTAMRESLANAFEQMAKGFCQMSKNLRS